jgi:hypothetical protein
MKSVIFTLVLLLCSSLILAQKKNKNRLSHFGLYAGYNLNSIDHTALDHLTDLWNLSHRSSDVISPYKDFLRMSGFSGGLMSYYKALYVDIGFDIRKNTQLARFKDVVGQFESQTLVMNSFHIGAGMNMNTGKDIVMISPGVALGIGRVEIEKGLYRTLVDTEIPLTQQKPNVKVDNSSSMSALNTFATIFVNVNIGKFNGRMPKLIIQPYLTIPLNKTDLSPAFYPTSSKAFDPALKAYLSFWGVKTAIGF